MSALSGADVILIIKSTIFIFPQLIKLENRKMKITKLFLFLAVLSGSAVVQQAKAECTEATQSDTCICFPAPVGCIDTTDPLPPRG